MTVFYNGAEGPLRNVKSGLNVQVGINGWQDLKRIELAPSDPPSSSLPKEGEPVTEAGEARSEEIRSNETAAGESWGGLEVAAQQCSGDRWQVEQGTQPAVPRGRS